MTSIQRGPQSQPIKWNLIQSIFEVPAMQLKYLLYRWEVGEIRYHLPHPAPLHGGGLLENFPNLVTQYLLKSSQNPEPWSKALVVTSWLCRQANRWQSLYSSKWTAGQESLASLSWWFTSKSGSELDKKRFAIWGCGQLLWSLQLQGSLRGQRFNRIYCMQGTPMRHELHCLWLLSANSI